MGKSNIWVLTAIICLFAVGCNNLSSTEKKIVGKYYITQFEEIEETGEDPPMTISMEGTQHYRADRTTTMDATMKLLIELEDYDYYNVVTIEYKILAEGKWESDGITLTERADPRTVKFEYTGSTATENDDISRRAIKIMRQYIDANQTSIKKEMLDSSSEIISLTDREMILEEDDTETTYTRL